MTRLDLLNRVITAAGLVTLAVTLGVWLSRSPLTAAPPSVPNAAPEPTPAPLPIWSVLPEITAIAAQIAVETAPLPAASVVADPPPIVPARPRAAKSNPAATRSDRQPVSQPCRGRGLFRRRRRRASS
jgi:hypothetical protein